MVLLIVTLLSASQACSAMALSGLGGHPCCPQCPMSEQSSSDPCSTTACASNVPGEQAAPLDAMNQAPAVIQTEPAPALEAIQWETFVPAACRALAPALFLANQQLLI